MERPTKQFNGKLSENIPLHNRSFKRALPQILATFAKNLLLLSNGLILGLQTVAIPALQINGNNNTENEGGLRADKLKLTDDQISWFGSINFICVSLGSLISGTVTYPFGPKRSMMALNIPFLIVWILLYNASSVTTLYIALVICGLTVGFLEAPEITYVAEIAEPHLRGMLGSISPTTVITGLVSQLILGNFFHWRTIVFINMLVPITGFIALSFVPESPHWLINKGRIKDAEKSLCWLRGWIEPEMIQQELSMLVKYIETQKRQHQIKYMFKCYWSRTFLLPFFIVTAVFFFSHFGGMTSLHTNAVKSFESFKVPMDAYKATLILGVLDFVGAIVCIISVQWTRKRFLLIASASLTSVCLLTLAVYSYILTQNPQLVTDVKWIPIIFLNAAIFFMNIGICVLPWVLIGEIFPEGIRSTASGASAFCFNLFAFASNKSFYWMLDVLQLHGLMLLYSTSFIFGSIFMYFLLPETEHRTLEEIQRHFADKRNTFKMRIAETSNPATSLEEDYVTSAIAKSKNHSDLKTKSSSEVLPLFTNAAVA